MEKTVIWAFLLVCLLSTTAFAKQSIAEPGKFDSYVFALSWQPAFCESKQDKKECTSQTPDRYDAKNLVLHGLWPNKNDDKNHKYGFCNVKNSIKKLDSAKKWCKMPAPDLSTATKDSLAKYMPGYASCLERHEWYKHGSCSGLEADEYFTKAYQFVAKVAETNFGKYISVNVGHTIDSSILFAEFEKDFGPGSRKLVNLYCTDNQNPSMLTEVRMYLVNPLPDGGEFKDLLTQPANSEHGNCPENIFIDPVQGWQATTDATTTDADTGKNVITQASSLAPQLEKGHYVDWWFVFKFNADSFPGCGNDIKRECPFGGTVQNYKSGFSQQFIYSSSEHPDLQQGSTCIGDTLKDPVGATFDQVYNGSYYYVIWNDQFYNDPKIKGCGQSCGAPWGHSKGMVAWDDNGEGFVMQVTTPSWPAAGSASAPRTDGNTLGCIENDNNVLVSQHFFALKISKDDLSKVLQAIQNASVVTDPTNMQIVKNGGPSDIQALVKQLGNKSEQSDSLDVTLSSGVELISKPSELHVPPWQLVSAKLKGVPLRAATWWGNPNAIYSTTASTPIGCWSSGLGKAGPVQIATSGQWAGKSLNLKEGTRPAGNHAKIGVSTDPATPYAIFGDMNQQGSLSDKCTASQNSRGGLFYIIKNKKLFDSLSNLLKGDTAPIVQ